jgi:hypothetical protein
MARPTAADLLKHPFFKNVPGPEVIVPLVKQADEIVAKRGFRVADSDSESESGSDEESSEEEEYSSEDEEIDLKRLTIGSEAGATLAAQVRATLTAEQSDDSDSDEEDAPATVMFSNVTDLQSQLEVRPRFRFPKKF